MAEFRYEERLGTTFCPTVKFDGCIFELSIGNDAIYLTQSHINKLVEYVKKCNSRTFPIEKE